MTKGAQLRLPRWRGVPDVAYYHRLRQLANVRGISPVFSEHGETLFCNAIATRFVEMGEVVVHCDGGVVGLAMCAAERGEPVKCVVRGVVSTSKEQYAVAKRAMPR